MACFTQDPVVAERCRASGGLLPSRQLRPAIEVGLPRSQATVLEGPLSQGRWVSQDEAGDG